MAAPLVALAKLIAVQRRLPQPLQLTLDATLLGMLSLGWE